MPVTVLVVEDERLIARHLRVTLEEAGYSVLGTVATADDAIAVCEAQVPDVVLMDIALRQSTMDGIAIASELYIRHQLRVIYLTAGIDDLESLERAKYTRPHAYLLKPINVGELLGAVSIAARYCGNATSSGVR